MAETFRGEVLIPCLPQIFDRLLKKFALGLFDSEAILFDAFEHSSKIL